MACGPFGVLGTTVGVQGAGGISWRTGGRAMPMARQIGSMVGPRRSQSGPAAVLRRRAAAAGITAPIGNHTFRATGITAYLANGGTLEHAKKWTEPKVFMLTTSIGSTRSRPICYPIVTPRSPLSSGDHALLTCDWTLVAERGIVQKNKIGTHRTPSESPGRPHPWRKTAVSNGQTPPGTR
jgi:hypothetical protein